MFSVPRRGTKKQKTENKKNETQIKVRMAYADREIFIFPVELTTSRIGNLTRLIHTVLLLYV